MTNFNSSMPTDSLADRKPSESEVATLIGDLISLWAPHNEGGLRVRHDTGCRINALIGPPSRRQKYGDRVLNQVAVQIHVSRSDLSRMRKFAHVCPDLDAFLGSHSECTSWSQVKVHLATLVSTDSVRENRTPADRIKAICRSIAGLAEKIEALKPLTSQERTQINAALNDLKKAASGHLARPAHVDTEKTSLGTSQSAA